MRPAEFLQSTRAKIQGLRTARSAYASQFAPEFNAIELLSPGELELSNIFRELLDPRGSHAQGREFLDIFIRQLGLSDFAGKEVLSVLTEVSTDANQGSERRIDILIELADNEKNGKFAIAIENKPWASDGTDQVKDYLAHLKTRYPRRSVLIYLPGDDERIPEEHSISKGDFDDARVEGRLITCSYSGLLPWLAACRMGCEAPSVQTFLQSLEQYIRKQFVGIHDMTERKLIIEDVTRSPETVEIFMELLAAQTDVKRALINSLEHQLTPSIDGHDWTMIERMDITKPYGALAIQLTRDDQYTVSFGFDQCGGGRFYYGIYKEHESDSDLPDVRAALDLHFNIKGKTTTWWPWYRDFDQPIRDWRSSSLPWVQIANGEMAKWMIKTVDAIEQGLQQAGVATQLKGNGSRWPTSSRESGEADI